MYINFDFKNERQKTIELKLQICSKHTQFKKKINPFTWF